jgi:hypothetical protein
MNTETKPIQTHTFVSLTPDDILTLKLLRDEYRKWFIKRDLKRRDVDTERTLETLERILKQVG